MRRLWAVIAVVAALSVSVPVYWVLTHPAAASPCSGSGSASLGDLPPGFGSISTAMRSGTYWYNTTIVGLPGGLRASQVSFQVLVPGESPSNGTSPPGVARIVVSNGTESPIAVENPSNQTWIEGASTPLQSGDGVSVVASRSLTMDDLVGEWPGQCGTSVSSATLP